MSLVLTIVLAAALQIVSCARILIVIPTPSYSHSVTFRALTHELSKNHEIVVWTANPQFKAGESTKNITELDFHDLSYAYENRKELLENVSVLKPLDFNLLVLEHLIRLFKRQAQTTLGQNFLQSSQKFDLLMLEACSPMAMTLAYAFKAPVIQISSFTGYHKNFYYMGTPTHPLLYPEVYRLRIHDLSLLEKIQGLYEDLALKSQRWITFNLENETVLEIFGPEVPPISKLEEDVEKLFLNDHSMWHGNRPVTPNVVLVGGLNQQTEKPLPEELKAYLDSSANGVIYMSLGSNLDPTLFPAPILQIFLNFFSRLPQNVILKCISELPEKPSNVRLEKWLPQADLLRHPNVKLFITQAGLQSTEEAIIAGVPMIALPVLGDQFYNAQKYEYFGIGVMMDLKTLTEDALMEAVTNILNDARYQENIARLRYQIRDQPQTPLERAIWWTEYTLRHNGSQHLRPTRTTWTEWLLLDVLVTLLVFMVTAILVVAFVFMRMIKLWTPPKLKEY